MVSLLSNEYKIKFSLPSADARNDWTPLYGYDFGWWWYSTELSSALEDGIFTLSNKSISFPVLVNESSYLLIKSKGIFNVANQVINSPKLAWSQIPVNTSANIIITPLSNESYIASIYVVPVSVYESAYSEFINESYNKSIISYSELTTSCSPPEKVINFYNAGVVQEGCGSNCSFNYAFNDDMTSGNFTTYFFGNGSADEFVVIYQVININLNRIIVCFYEF